MSYINGDFRFIYAPLIIMASMHHSFLTVAIQLIASGTSFLFDIVAFNNVSQGETSLSGNEM